MNVARLNFSHGTQEEHGDWIRRIRELSERLRLPVAILQDLAGPKVRIGEVPGGEITLRDGEEFYLSVGACGGQAGVTVNYPADHRRNAGGGRHPAGRWEHRTEGGREGPTGPALPGGGGWGITLPGGDKFPRPLPVGAGPHGQGLGRPAPSGWPRGWTSWPCPTCARARDVREAREFIRGRGADTPIIAKIEKHEALGQLEEILDAADGLMVARGDLGVEVPLERVPMIQKQIIAAANRAGKPVITATQMLLSMVNHARPSRAEATDVANAILDGTDAVMLSEETAVGQYPVEAVTFLDQVSRATEEDFPNTAWLRSRAAEGRREIPEAVSYAACEMALDLEAAAILTNTDGGGTARLISRFRPAEPHHRLYFPAGDLAPPLPFLGRFAPFDPSASGHRRDVAGGGGGGGAGRTTPLRRPGDHHRRHPHRHPGHHQPHQGGRNFLELSAFSLQAAKILNPRYPPLSKGGYLRVPLRSPPSGAILCGS